MHLCLLPHRHCQARRLWQEGRAFHHRPPLPRFKLPGKLDDIAGKVTPLRTTVTHEKAFLHFQLNSQSLVRRVLEQVHAKAHLTESKKPEYSTSTSGKGKKIIIEYSSPNIAKPLAEHHHRPVPRKPVRVVRMGRRKDELPWGLGNSVRPHRHRGLEKYGSQEELEKDAIKHLFDVYIKVNKEAEGDSNVKVEAVKWFKRMEDGDEAALANWRVWRELSVKKYEEQYDTPNVKFDIFNGESMVGKEWQDKALERLNSMGLITDADGAKIVDLSKWKLGSAVGRKKDGTSIYLTRDIGGAIERYEKYQVDEMIYVVSSQQDLHLAQFFKVLELMEFPWAKNLQHVNYGLVQGMSIRKGTVNEEKFAVLEDPETVARKIGITGVKIQDMTAKRPGQINTASLASIPHAGEIVFLLWTYPDVIKTALRTHEASGIVTFAFRLSHAISSAWEMEIVKGEEDVEKAKARMFMYECARDVLAAAMRLLSIRPLERM
ncbi:hypothetical protein H0H92_014867 [Tricholoma furcatifolium]|nr:hypothetical protein H0H92_014867 [Tricholoma furcatifolium]